jgi:4a-hydroxytetrahydrobiopterin dehydratase
MIVCLPGLAGAGVLMTVTDGQLTVGLTRGVERLEDRHVQLAQAVSAVAREHGAVAAGKRRIPG